jgi:anti-sigma factor RsiW
MTCPDLLLLSQLLDGELPATTGGAAVRTHVDACAVCREQLARLDRATAAGRAALAEHEAAAPPGAPQPDCLTPGRIAGWVGRVLADADLRAVDAHLERCDVCLEEALAARRMIATLDAEPRVAIPDALRARVASRWQVAPARESLTELVIRVARAGVTLIERHVVAPVLDVEELLSPAPAVRAEEAAGAVSFRIRAPEAEIQATIVPDGEAVGLSLSLLGADDVALVGQRVFLRRHGRSLYSARTDAAGALRLPRIEPGVYEVSCPGIGTSFRLDLRP